MRNRHHATKHADATMWAASYQLPVLVFAVCQFEVASLNLRDRVQAKVKRCAPCRERTEGTG